MMNRKHIRILLAEDDPGNQICTKLLLKEMGHQSDVVADGMAVIEALKNTPYDLVLMDCNMPGMDGYEATQCLRNPEYGAIDPDIPVIAYTGNTLEEEIKKCFDAGMNDYIQKPSCIDEFKSTISKWLKKTQVHCRHHR